MEGKERDGTGWNEMELGGEGRGGENGGRKDVEVNM